MRISDWSSDVCSSDLYIPFNALVPDRLSVVRITRGGGAGPFGAGAVAGTIELGSATRSDLPPYEASLFAGSRDSLMASANRSEEHTSALQSLMRISYAVFCLKINTIILQIAYY